jgi:hypothetical protein
MARTRIALALVSLALLATTARAEDKKPAAAPAGAPAGLDAGMAAMMKAATPGPQHQHLAKMAGDWTFTSTVWMQAGAQPQTSTGTMHAEMLMGGRYVEHHWKGNMMGMEFEGQGTEAYDNVSKQWVSTWIDNMGTGLMMQTGTGNDAMSSFDYRGDMWDGMSGKKVRTHSVITWIDDNTFKNEMFAPTPDGKEFKTMEIVAKRKM